MQMLAETAHITRITIPFLDIDTAVFLIDTPDGRILFDTATYPTDIDEYILPAGITPHMIVISHNHRDHAGGLARAAECFPEAVIAAGSNACAERIPGRDVRILADGELLAGCLRVVAIPGHTADAIGLLDTRTMTLLSGDALQCAGIYGSGNWGANISYQRAHREACARLGGMGIGTILASHDYHPCGRRADADGVARYLDACTAALDAIRDFAGAHPDMPPEALAAAYNGASGLPTVGAHIFAAARRG